MREVDIGDSKALLVNQNGQFHAIGHKCTHYGAPLVKGYLGEGRVRCPWHGACFNITSGDIEEFPGLDNVPCFQVSEFIKGTTSLAHLEVQRTPLHFQADVMFSSFNYSLIHKN